MNILSFDEAKAFLTKADLQQLEEQVLREKLDNTFGDGGAPFIVVRKKNIPLFAVLELMGTL